MVVKVRWWDRLGLWVVETRAGLFPFALESSARDLKAEILGRGREALEPFGQLPPAAAALYSKERHETHA